jgi:hypothetical protein
MRMMSPLLALGLAGVLPPVLAQTVAKQAQAPAPAAQQKPATQKHHRKPKAEPVAEPAPPVPTVAPNMLDQPASPATVKAANNELTVTAENSSLSQILRQVSSQTGMRLDGISADERVFGSFGPGATREVLTALLNGTSYNMIMVGDLPNGAPRELLLSRRSGGAEPHSSAVAANGIPNPNPNATANGVQDQEQAPNPDENPPEDNSGDDNADDSAPPMQYTPPSITPAEPTPGEQNAPGDQNGPPEGVAPRAIPMQPPPQ